MATVEKVFITTWTAHFPQAYDSTGPGAQAPLLRAAQEACGQPGFFRSRINFATSLILWAAHAQVHALLTYREYTFQPRDYLSFRLCTDMQILESIIFPDTNCCHLVYILPPASQNTLSNPYINTSFVQPSSANSYSNFPADLYLWATIWQTEEKSFVPRNSMMTMQWLF